MKKLELWKFIYKVLLVICLQMPWFAYAAEFSIHQVPNVFDPGQFSKSLRTNSMPALTPAPPLPHNAHPAPPSNLPPEAAKIKLPLNGVIFSGNTVYSDAELMKIFQPSLHKVITLADLQGLVADVTKKYRAAGYILSRAFLPAQEIKNGMVKVQIIEGYVSKVTVTGNVGRLKYKLEKFGDNIMQSKPLQISVMEKQLLYANDIPGVTVRAVLTPSEKIPGSANLSLVVEQKRVSAVGTYDNYSTRFIGPQEYSAGVTLNSVLFPGDSNTARLVATSDFTELRYYEFVHTDVIGTKGTNLVVGTNYTQTNPGFLLNSTNTIGESYSLYGNLFFPVLRTRSQNFMWRSGFNYQNVTSTILDQPFYQDRIRSLMLGFYYDKLDRFQAYNTLQFDLSHGFPILGAKNHQLQSRPQGNTNYTKFIGSYSRLQPLGGRYSMYLSMFGQYAFDSLLTTEQYAFGGPTYGRGYGPSEIIGDRAAVGKIELRADTNPDFRFLQTVQYYVFYDAGIVWDIDNLNLKAKEDATSTGIGARIGIMPHVSGEVFLAKPLTHKALTLTPLDQNPYQARVFFQLVLRA